MKTVSLVCRFTALPQHAEGPSPDLSEALWPPLKTAQGAFCFFGAAERSAYVMKAYAKLPGEGPTDT